MKHQLSLSTLLLKLCNSFILSHLNFCLLLSPVVVLSGNKITTNAGTSRKYPNSHFPLLWYHYMRLYLILHIPLGLFSPLENSFSYYSKANVGIFSSFRDGILLFQTLIKSCLNFLYLYTNICRLHDWNQAILAYAEPQHQAPLGSQYSKNLIYFLVVAKWYNTHWCPAAGQILCTESDHI